MLLRALGALLLLPMLCAGHAAAASANSRQVNAAAGATLRLANAVFQPATVTRSTAVKAAAMDDTRTWPRLYHSRSYASLGLRAAYVQTAQWMPAAAAGTVTFGYAGSIFATEPGAYGAWEDEVTYWPGKYRNIQAVTCPAVSAPVCSRWELAGNNGITEWDDAVQMGRCLIETRAFAPAALFAAQESQVTATLAAIDTAAVTAAQRACGVAAPAAPLTGAGTALGIDALRVEKDGAASDWSLVKSSLRQVTAGEPLSLNVYYTVRNPPAGAQARFVMIVRRGRRVLLDDRTAPNGLSAAIAQYRHWVHFTPPSAGRYQFTATVTVGGLAVTGALSFTVHA